MKAGFPSYVILSVLLMAALPAFAETKTERRDHRQAVCVINGKVTGMQAIEKTPWNDGTPSTLTVTEIHMSVTVESRKPQRAGISAEDCAMPESSTSLYKLCSPTQVKLGDRIMGTEGLATGSESALGCLFDVVVLPPAERP